MYKKVGILLLVLALAALALTVGCLAGSARPGPTSQPPASAGSSSASAAPSASPVPTASASASSQAVSNSLAEPGSGSVSSTVPGSSALPAAAALPIAGAPFDLSTLSNKREAWGQGKEVNELNQPTGSVQWQQKYGEYGGLFLAKDPTAKTVYLTFDFGYETGYSGAILDVLQQKNATATFFVVLGYAKEQADTITRMLAEGHTVGSHSIKHKDLTQYSTEQAQQELAAFNTQFQQLYGVAPGYFRFPEGVFSQRMIAAAANEGMYSVFWSYAYKDWDPDNQPDPDTALQKALKAAHPGAIYLLHPMATNAKILPDLIDGLRQMGYTVEAL